MWKRNSGTIFKNDIKLPLGQEQKLSPELMKQYLDHRKQMFQINPFLPFPTPCDITQRVEWVQEQVVRVDSQLTTLQLCGRQQAYLISLCFRVLTHKIEIVHFTPTVWKFSKIIQKKAFAHSKLSKKCHSLSFFNNYYP